MPVVPLQKTLTCRAACAALLCLLSASAAVAQQPSWEEIGPNGVGGRVSAIAADPQSPGHVIVGTPAGGLWQTHDGATTWTPLTLWLSTLPISTIAIDPGNSARMFVGTGSIDDAGAVSAGTGVLATADGGATWAMRDVGVQGAYVSTIVVWPAESTRVLVGTDLGIRISTDGGATFVSALDGQAVSSIRLDPFDANAAYASSRSGLLKSTDRGQTWTTVAAWPLLSTDMYGAGTTALAVSSTSPGVLYASVQVLATFNRTGRVMLLRSSDGGQSFTELAAPSNLCPGPETCGFAQALTLDPVNDSHLLAGGEDLYASVDAGASWQTVTGGLQGAHDFSVADGQVLAIGRFGVALLDSGWTSAQPRNAGLAITAVHSLDVVTSPETRLLAGTADSGTLLGSGDTPAWRVIFAPGQPVGPAKFDPFDVNTIMASKIGGDLFRSVDGGMTFTSASSGLDLTQTATRYAPIAPAPLEQGTWYTGRLQMFSSSTGGSTWTAFRPAGFPEIGLIETSPVVSQRLYFATTDGGALYKADADTTEQLVVSSESNLRLSSLYLDPTAQNRMYVAGMNTADQTGRAYKSADFGVTWTNITPPALAPATSILKDAYGALYIGTRNGVWRSANDGYSWVPFTNGLLAGGVNVRKRGGGWLYAGTTGRGVFRMRELPLVSIESMPSGVQFMVDGQVVTGPFVTYWAAGSTHTITPVLTNTTSTREEFLGWLDGSSQSQTVTATGGNMWMMAAIRRSFTLSAAPSPSAGGSVTFTPASSDGFYPQNTFVKVIPVPAPDYRVSGFSGQVSGNDGLVAFAVMDQPRTVQALFSPLQIHVQSDPDALQLSVDGAAITTPTMYQWSAGSVHAVSAPELVGTSVYDPVLAFDHWSDLRAATHDVLVTRDTFVTDLKASYISTVRGVRVPAGGARAITTTRLGDVPRMAALTLTPDGQGGIPAALQFVRGHVDDTTSEFALVPSSPRTWTNVVIQQDTNGSAGRVHIAAFNPGSVDATVGILLRDSSGIVQAATGSAFVVPAGAHVTAWLDELMQLPPAFTSLVTLIATQPLVTSVQSWRGNVRPTHVLDPLIVAPLTQGDSGVPLDSRVQVALLTPDTTHRLIVVNTGFSPLSGNVDFRDPTGAPATVQTPDGSVSSFAYALGPGAFQIVDFTASAAGDLPTLQIVVTPGSGQPAPALQMLEEQHVGDVDGSPTLLPRTLPPSTPAQSFTVPVNRARRETGMVFTNTSPYTITLTLGLTDLDGVLQLTTTTTVAPLSQAVVSTDVVAAALGTGFAGELTVTSDIPVHAVGFLRFVNGRTETIVAGFPAVLPATPVVTLPFAIDGDSWQSEWWFMNGTGAETRSLLDFRGRGGTVVYFPVE